MPASFHSTGISGISLAPGTDTSGSSSGSLVTTGGTGIARKLYVGEIAVVESSLVSSTPTTGAAVTKGGLGIARQLCRYTLPD